MFLYVMLAVYTPVVLFFVRLADVSLRVVSTMVRVLLLETPTPGALTVMIALPGLATREAGTAALRWVGEMKVVVRGVVVPPTVQSTPALLAKLQCVRALSDRVKAGLPALQVIGSMGPRIGLVRLKRKTVPAPLGSPL